MLQYVGYFKPHHFITRSLDPFRAIYACICVGVCMNRNNVSHFLIVLPHSSYFPPSLCNREKIRTHIRYYLGYTAANISKDRPL